MPVKGQNQDPVWVQGEVKIYEDGLIEAPEAKVNTGSLKLDNCTTVYTDSRNIEWLSNAEPARRESISSIYDETGSYPPTYTKKGALRTLDGQLLDDAQTTGSSITIPIPEDSHWMELILKPRAAGLAKFNIRYTNASGCVLNSITMYTFQPAEVDTEVSVPLGNPISLIGGRVIYVTYEGVAVAGHNYSGDPIWGTQFVPFVKTKSHPYEDVNLVTADRDRASVYKGSAQTIVKETWTDLTFDNERFDVGDMHNNVTNNARFTINKTALYEIKYLINIQSKKDTDYQGRVYLNGAGMLPDSQLCFFSPKDDTDMCIQNSFYAELTVGDYITLQAYQGSAVDRDVHAEKTFFQIREI